MGPSGLRRPRPADRQEGLEVADVPGHQREADRALTALVTEQPSAQAPAPSRTFGELLERWFEARSGDWSPSTAQQTRWVINGNLKGLSDR